MEDDILLSRRRGSLQLWAACSVENLSLSHDDSVLQMRTRGRSKHRKSKCLSWLGKILVESAVSGIVTCLLFCVFLFNPLPNDKILDVAKLKAFADDNLRVARMMISVLHRVEKTGGKGENAGYQHFLLFAQCFPKPSSLGLLKVGIVC